MADRDDKAPLKGKSGQQASDQGHGSGDGVEPKYSAPAPELHPPGMGRTPQQQGYPMETEKETERRVLKDNLKGQVRGDIGGANLMDADWGAATGQSSADRFASKQPQGMHQAQTAGQKKSGPVTATQSSADRHAAKVAAQRGQSSGQAQAPGASPEQVRKTAAAVQQAQKSQAAVKTAQQQDAQAGGQKPAGSVQQGPKTAAAVDQAQTSQAAVKTAQQQQVSEAAYRNMLYTRGEKLVDRDRARGQEQGLSRSRDRD